MQNMTLDSLSFLCGPAPSTTYGVWLQQPVQGFDATDYRVVQYPIPGQDNARVASAFYDARTITLSGLINGSNVADYMNNRSLLGQACAINRDQYGYPVLKRLSFTTLEGKEYFLMVQPKKPVFDMTYMTWTKYVLSLIAPDPRIYSTTQTVATITPLVSRGIIVPTIVPVLGGGTSGGSTSVINQGTTASHPILTFNGPLTNPYVQNVASGQAFQIDYAIPGGVSVIVDMYEHSMVYNGSTNFIQYRDPISSWWTVEPGGNTFTLSTSTSSDTGNVSIAYYEARETV